MKRGVLIDKPLVVKPFGLYPLTGEKESGLFAIEEAQKPCGSRPKRWAVENVAERVNKLPHSNGVWGGGVIDAVGVRMGDKIVKGAGKVVEVNPAEPRAARSGDASQTALIYREHLLQHPSLFAENNADSDNGKANACCGNAGCRLFGFAANRRQKVGAGRGCFIEDLIAMRAIIPNGGGIDKHRWLGWRLGHAVDQGRCDAAPAFADFGFLFFTPSFAADAFASQVDEGISGGDGADQGLGACSVPCEIGASRFCLGWGKAGQDGHCVTAVDEVGG